MRRDDVIVNDVARSNVVADGFRERILEEPFEARHFGAAPAGSMARAACASACSGSMSERSLEDKRSSRTSTAHGAACR